MRIKSSVVAPKSFLAHPSWSSEKNKEKRHVSHLFDGKDIFIFSTALTSSLSTYLKSSKLVSFVFVFVDMRRKLVSEACAFFFLKIISVTVLKIDEVIAKWQTTRRKREEFETLLQVEWIFLPKSRKYVQSIRSLERLIQVTEQPSADHRGLFASSQILLSIMRRRSPELAGSRPSFVLQQFVSIVTIEFYSRWRARTSQGHFHTVCTFISQSL